MGLVINTKTAVALSSADTVVTRKTQLDPKPSKPVEIQRISDAGVVCYAHWFGFTGKILSETQITDELRDVVTYAYWIMNGQEEKEMKEKAKIPKPTWWQSRLAGEPTLVKFLLGANTKYFDCSESFSDWTQNPNGTIKRQLRDGLGIDRKTSDQDVFRGLLKEIRELKVKV